jgi:hypothetical protein
MSKTSDDGLETQTTARSRAPAVRALAEAELRRKARSNASDRPPESGGPKGLEPIRYGDWDVNGRASDF